ncbi:hypothetical protein P7H12_25985 [Paenibacillus larvae]|nr:hypothetical protein [Paenibacillus larvae]MDT2266364.1 hypothetical protein [Paenibacillus larvae]
MQTKTQQSAIYTVPSFARLAQNGITARQALTYALRSNTDGYRAEIDWQGIATFDWQDYPTALAAIDIGRQFSGGARFRVSLRMVRLAIGTSV